MNSWLVLDLRDSHLAAGFVEITNDRPQWTPGRVEIFPVPGSPAYVFEADLAFFKTPSERNWSPTRKDFNSFNERGYEFFPDLFSKSLNEIEELLRNSLYCLINKLLIEYKGLPILIILDREDLKIPLRKFFQKIKRDTIFFVTSGSEDDYEGYALLPPTGALPSKGEILVSLIYKNNSTEEKYCFEWTGDHFRVFPACFAPDKKPYIWSSVKDQERAGIAMYALVWEQRLFGSLDERLEKEIQKNQLLTSLYQRVNELRTRVREYYQKEAL